MNSIDQPRQDQFIERWIKNRPTRIERIQNTLLAVWHTKIWTKVPAIRTVRVLLTATLAGASPMTAHIFDPVKAPFWPAAMIAIGLIVGNFLIYALDRAAENRRKPPDEDLSDLLVRMTEIVTLTGRNRRAQKEANDIVRAYLAVIQIYTAQVTKTGADNISVNVAVYRANSDKQMILKHRNNGSKRPVQFEFPADQALGHYVCKADNGPKVINEFKIVPKELRSSPTNSPVVYRSILFIPLKADIDGKEVIRGFLSVDCTKPYAFVGIRGRNITQQTAALVRQIGELV